MVKIGFSSILSCLFIRSISFFFFFILVQFVPFSQLYLTELPLSHILC